MILLFKVKKARENGRSPIEMILGNNKTMIDNTDNILSGLDKLLKKSKLEVGDLREIKLEIDKEAGLTSQRIVKSIIKALCLDF